MNATRGLAQDFRQAARRLVSAPLFTSFAVFSLAIGVAVTTAGYNIAIPMGGRWTLAIQPVLGVTALAMVGLFGVQTHAVGSRIREIGLRMSMGATAGQIQAMVLKDGYRPVIEGLVLGAAGGIAGRIIVRTHLDIQISVIDPWMIGAVPLPLIAAAFCACYMPARTDARVDPDVALRHV